MHDGKGRSSRGWRLKQSPMDGWRASVRRSSVETATTRPRVHFMTSLSAPAVLVTVNAAPWLHASEPQLH